MLQIAKDLQNQAVKNLLNILPHKQNITFKAPTGSGKTFMMADFMDRVLQENNNVVFILSSLSKGNLSEQNFKSIQKFGQLHFKNLKPYLITSETSGENALAIPLGYNVYVLPRDLYKEKSKLKQGSFVGFLRELKGYAKNLSNKAYKEYQIYLIKDECHIATSNLDSLSKEYFSKIINFSATPKLERGQVADVEIKNEEAISSGLIKDVEYNENDDLEKALDKFLELKEKYQELVGINPALIIQISNKDKADKELKTIKDHLSKGKFSQLKYMYIVDKEKDYDTNDFFKAKKLPPKKWKHFAKENSSLIDIIIFKMVISEGWDIPRACMLFQMRDSKSKQLDEQVIGRVRRNPCLLDYQTLDLQTREFISKAYVYGIKPKEDSSIRVFLKGFSSKDGKEGLFNEIQKEFILNTTALNIQKPQAKNNNFVEKALSNIQNSPKDINIFELYRALQKQDENIKKECQRYTQEQGFQGWFKFNKNLKFIVKEYEKVAQDYENSMEVVQSNACVLPFESIFSQTEHKRSIPYWVWHTQTDSKDFCFDSQAEKEWFEFLYDEIREKEHTKGKLIKSIKIDGEHIYLLGKNFVYQSGLKFEYFFQGTAHTSYPDFVLKDWVGRFHIFEVKSLNIAKDFRGDRNEYEEKIEALKKCYKAASKKLNYHFYIPIKVTQEWQIYYFYDGQEENITKSIFKEILESQ